MNWYLFATLYFIVSQVFAKMPIDSTAAVKLPQAGSRSVVTLHPNTFVLKFAPFSWGLHAMAQSITC